MGVLRGLPSGENTGHEVTIMVTERINTPHFPRELNEPFVLSGAQGPSAEINNSSNQEQKIRENKCFSPLSIGFSHQRRSEEKKIILYESKRVKLLSCFDT
ncbi:hypothetical protein NPIL_56311 [Nephila pilipes]|uniref:Uncharacterized protein n=1 Tax=Nephila pilipes TaxID=299642 RepID=A0A8X6NYZ6_NEPPI|nr:hypothetical protein NPIL_56311 [Nephila pilipes]